MVQVVVTGIGLVSALGISLKQSWHNLLLGKTGIQRHQPFKELGSLPLGMIDSQPSQLKHLSSLLVDLTLEDAGLLPPLPDTAVVIGSSRGFQAEWEQIIRSPDFRQNCQQNWLDYLPHMNAIAIARKIGATGIVQSPMAACATGLTAIAQAFLLIKSGQSHRVITGAVEAPITPLTIAGFRQMGALAKTGAYPFDKDREGLVLGEGGAFLMLESLESAQKRQANIYGEILGFGLTNDGYHPNAPNPTGKSPIYAIQACLERSGLQARNIDYIHAHGTATIRNDEVESTVIQQVFPHYPHIRSTKGATGHTIGASGALGVAFCLMTLKTQTIPPCIGLRSSNFDLNLFDHHSRKLIQNIICLSFGFGGINASIAIGISNR